MNLNKNELDDYRKFSSRNTFDQNSHSTQNLNFLNPNNQLDEFRKFSSRSTILEKYDSNHSFNNTDNNSIIINSNSNIHNNNEITNKNKNTSIYEDSKSSPSNILSIQKRN